MVFQLKINGETEYLFLICDACDIEQNITERSVLAYKRCNKKYDYCDNFVKLSCANCLQLEESAKEEIPIVSLNYHYLEILIVSLNFRKPCLGSTITSIHLIQSYS